MSDVHKGHRERLRERFMISGPSSFNDVTALELLLFYTLPRRDTNELAHRLLDRFGSLDRIMDASITDLTSVKGVGTETAIFLRLIPDMCRRYAMKKRPGMHIDCVDTAGSFITPMFICEHDEVFLAVFLDKKRNVINCCEVGRGVSCATNVEARKIVELALTMDAGGVIACHNHISRPPLPSVEDERLTEELRSGLGAVGIDLIDHFIVSGREYTSMRNCGFY